MDEIPQSTPYKVTETPLTQEDIHKLHKTLSDSYRINILLLPLLVIIYFWGALYFGFFAAFVIICNMMCAKNYISTQKELTKPKIVITGTVTKIRKDEETILYFGSEQVDITYANATFPIKINDVISIHYSKKEDNTKGQILGIVKVN